MQTIDAPLMAAATLIALGGVFVGFVVERRPPAVVALVGVAALVAIGALPVNVALGVLSNSAPVTIALLFILSAGLARTGVIDALSRALRRLADRSKPLAFTALVFGPMAISAFVSNTAVVMVLIPAMIGVARSLGASASRLLMPLSFACILGGAATLLGTSTNLLVDGVARGRGLEPFGAFEMTPVGLPVALVGAAYLLFVAPLLLPTRTTTLEAQGPQRGPRFVLEALIRAGSPLVGKELVKSTLFADNSIRVIDVLRGQESLRRELRAVVLQPGDRLVMRSDAEDLQELRADGLLSFGEDDLAHVAARTSTLLEALVGPNAELVGRDLGRLRLRRRYGVYPIAAHRRGVNLAAQLENAQLEVGDTILFEGAPDDLRRVIDDYQLIPLSDPTERAFRRKQAPIALAALGFVVGGAALAPAMLPGLALIAVAATLATRAVDLDDALRAVDGKLLILIYGMLAIAAAVDATGADLWIISVLDPLLAIAPPLLLLALLYAATALLTEAVTNNAVAVLIAPITIDVAARLALDPRPLLMLVMIAASASFATPIGYQTNTLVYGAGGYRFTDFLRVGAPLSALCGLTTVAAVYLLYFR